MCPSHSGKARQPTTAINTRSALHKHLMEQDGSEQDRVVLETKGSRLPVKEVLIETAWRDRKRAQRAWLIHTWVLEHCAKRFILSKHPPGDPGIKKQRCVAKRPLLVMEAREEDEKPPMCQCVQRIVSNFEKASNHQKRQVIAL